ncbi:hypothetical protein Tco_1276491 [Tanacetum coccineum]
MNGVQLEVVKTTSSASLQDCETEVELSNRFTSTVISAAFISIFFVAIESRCCPCCSLTIDDNLRLSFYIQLGG